MMREHVVDDDLRALREKRLDGRAIAEVMRHLASCARCAAKAQEGLDAGAATSALNREFSDHEHPDLEQEIFPFADGTLDRARRAAVSAHLLACARCREDVADARAEHRKRSTTSRASTIRR